MTFCKKTAPILWSFFSHFRGRISTEILLGGIFVPKAFIPSPSICIAEPLQLDGIFADMTFAAVFIGKLKKCPMNLTLIQVFF